MKPYIKGLLGGLLAILAAFGWTANLGFLILWKYQKEGTDFGFYASNGRVLWIVRFLIFAVGFYLAFRSAYCSTSK